MGDPWERFTSLKEMVPLRSRSHESKMASICSLGSTWEMHGRYVGDAWEIHGIQEDGVDLLLGQYLAPTTRWKVRGRFVEGSWKVHGRFTLGQYLDPYHALDGSPELVAIELAVA